MISLPATVRATLVGLCVSASFAAQAAPFKDLHDFTANPDGREPAGSPIDYANLWYGTTSAGGTSDAGSIYVLDPKKTHDETILHNFTGAFGGHADGSAPVGELADVYGQFFGTTSLGGEFNGGTIFRYDPVTKIETVLYSFGAGHDGLSPAAGLVEVNLTLYGTTSQGGTPGLGTVFSFDLNTLKETVLHEFAGGSDGASPFARLTVSGGDALYGTTYFGGKDNDGTVFRLDTATGETTVLHAFKGAPLSGNPAAALVYTQDGMLFGTTSHGGRPHCGGGCGTVFSVDAATGEETDIYRFKSRRDGFDPEGGMVIHNSTLYGTTSSGGPHKNGTVFSLNFKTGEKRTLHAFRGTDGANPGTLTQIAGRLFGTTHGGGAAGEGAVFRVLH